MPSEPIEAEFVHPPALTEKQEEQLRQLEREGPDSQQTTVLDIEGAHPEALIVTFEKGAGEDPREWPKAKKWYVTLVAAFLCLAAAIGSSLVTGDLLGPVEDLDTTQEIVNLTVTCFVIGFGIGPLFFAPLSEVVGRTPMYCTSMLFFFIFTLPSALAKNAATLVIGRQIAGLAASAPVCNVGGTVADVWAVEDRGVPMAVFSFTLFMGPCVGPLIGGFIAERAGWRWLYWVLFIFSGLCFFLTLFMPETIAPVLLKRKAERLRKETGDERYKTAQELERVPLTQALKIALLRPIIMLFTEPIVIFFSFYLSFIYSLLYLMFFAFPIAFAEIRGFSMGMTGVTFISIMLGIAGAMLVIPYQERLYAKVTRYGIYPEARLYPMMVGSITMPISLFIFAFTGAYASVHWIGPCIAGVVFGFSMLLIYISANSYIVDSYSAYAASAMAAKTFLRSEVGASVPLFVNQMFHHMGFQYAGLLLALIGVAIAPISFIFFKYGERIRKGSAKATQAIRRTSPVEEEGQAWEASDIEKKR